MYAGKIGINILNERLQERLNPYTLGKAEKKFGKTVFRVGDKLVETRNNYDVNIMNGDSGVLLEIARKELIINFSGRTVAIEFGKAGSLVHAFAISIHRAQGSEYRAVVMPVMTSHYVMLVRNLLYTGVTRAKELIVVVGQKRAIGMAVRNDKVRHRNSYLSERLKLDILI
jgi:exodeoxyribonuclease V alpha subunit